MRARVMFPASYSTLNVAIPKNGTAASADSCRDACYDYNTHKDSAGPACNGFNYAPDNCQLLRVATMGKGYPVNATAAGAGWSCHFNEYM